MLTSETYPQFFRGVPVPEGGRRMADSRKLSRIFSRGGNFLGDRLSDTGSAFESLSVLTEEGELLEAIVTDDEVVVGVNDTISAAYDREFGFLVSASFSLVSGVIEAKSRELLSLPEDLFKRAIELKRKKDDLVVVVDFDNDDGEAKVFLVRTENGRAVQLIKVIKQKEMHESYGEVEDEDGDPMPLDFVCEGEEELVGELLCAWLQYCPILNFAVNFGVGIRTQMVDFCLFDVEDEEALPYHVSELFDSSALDDRRLTRKMVSSFVSQAFPEMGWAH